MLPIIDPFSADQEPLIDAARHFADHEIWPLAPRFDAGDLSIEPLMGLAAANGMMNLSIPLNLGGMGLDPMAIARVVIELARGDGGVATSLVINDLALPVIVKAGTEAQKQRYVAELLARDGLAAYCQSEAGAGSDVAAVTTTATPVEGGYRLDGEKIWISNGPVAQQFTVLARIPGTKRHNGLLILIVPRSAEGVSVGKPEHKEGQRASPTSTVRFDEVFVSTEARIGGEGDGFKLSMSTLNGSRPYVAALAVGIATRALELGTEYAKTREQFGMTIGNFQLIQRLIANGAVDLKAATLLTLDAARHIMAGSADAPVAASAAKLFATEMAVRVTRDMMQLFGGIGYTVDARVGMLHRAALLTTVYEGTTEVQTSIIGKAVLGLR